MAKNTVEYFLSDFSPLLPKHPVNNTSVSITNYQLDTYFS